ncbi:MAG: hypothetical protein DRJ09_02560 [Bacteroidetes bacterium]|nr:MAG: hypothetical protein DRJ09_02560 [Bacteroidota bacterium]
MKHLSVFILILFTMISCTNHNGVYFEKSVPLEKHNWQRFHNIDFNVPVKKDKLLDFSMVFKYNEDFKDVWLPVNITFTTPGGEIRTRNYRFSLLNRKTRKKLGTTINHITTVVINIRKEMPFSANGDCVVSIEKRIPKMDTYGIVEVGLRVVESQPKAAPKEKAS